MDLLNFEPSKQSEPILINSRNFKSFNSNPIKHSEQVEINSDQSQQLKPFHSNSINAHRLSRIKSTSIQRASISSTLEIDSPALPYQSPQSRQAVQTISSCL